MAAHKSDGAQINTWNEWEAKMKWAQQDGKMEKEKHN